MMTPSKRDSYKAEIYKGYITLHPKKGGFAKTVSGYLMQMLTIHSPNQHFLSAYNNQNDQTTVTDVI